MIPKNKILAVANAVPEWEDSFPASTSTAPARRNDDVADFNFGQSAPTPVATKATAKAVAVVATIEPIAAPAASQPETFSDLTSIPAPRKPSMVEAAGARERVLRDFAGSIEAPPHDDAHKNPFLARVLKVPSVVAALKSARSEQLKYKKVLNETAELIGSDRKAQDLLTAIGNATDLATLEKLRGDYAETQGPAAQASAQSARRICRVAYAKLDAALHNLISVTVKELDALAPEIESAEVDLFAKFGLPHQMTGLMSHLHRIKTRVAHHAVNLNLNSGPERVNTILPNAGESILETFGA